MSQNRKKLMNKSGFIDGFSLIVFIVVVASIAGATYTLTEPKQLDSFEGYYVLDEENNLYYDVLCIKSSKSISDNIEITNSKEKLKSLNLTYVECPE